MMMEAKNYILLLSLFCFGCVTTPSPPREKQDKISKARVELLACGREAIPRLDDRISSAAIISSAIIQVCKSEADNLIDSVTLNSTDLEARKQVKKQLDKGRNFIPLVLEARAQSILKDPKPISGLASNFEECISEQANAWCALRASPDLVRSSFSRECKNERENYKKNYALENQHKLTPWQSEQAAEKVLIFKEEWETTKYIKNCS